MICLGCGCKLEIGAKFCPHCGKETALASGEVGTIKIVREKKTMGFAVSFDVFIDDEKVGVLANGSELTFDVPVGSHDIRLELLNSVTNQEVKLSSEKKNAIITVIPKMGLVAARPFVKNIEYK